MHGNSSPYDFDLSFVLFMFQQNILSYLFLYKIHPRVLHLLIIAVVVFFERRNFLNRETTPIHTLQLQSLEDVETPTDLPDEGLINSPRREFHQARNPADMLGGDHRRWKTDGKDRCRRSLNCLICQNCYVDLLDVDTCIFQVVT